MQVWALSDQGRVRKSNQDIFYYDDNGADTVALVCDGMGGAAAGELASRMAAESFVDSLNLQSSQIPERMLWAAEQANRSVYDYSLQHAECRGMGTTLVAAVVRGEQAWVLNLGDSRCYYLDEEGIKQVTRDHSVVAELVRRGELSPEQARRHPHRNMITRALGTQEGCAPELFQVRLKPGSLLLLCSDGLSNLLLDQEILFEALYGGPTATLCRRLLRLCLERGAPDNVTVLVLKNQ